MKTQGHQHLPAHHLIGKRSIRRYSNDPRPSTSTSMSYTRRSFEVLIRTSTYAHFVHAARSHTEVRTVPPGFVQAPLVKGKHSWIISKAITPRVQRLCIGTIIHAAPRIRHLTQTQEFVGLLSPSPRFPAVYWPSRIHGMAISLCRLHKYTLVEQNCYLYPFWQPLYLLVSL